MSSSSPTAVGVVTRSAKDADDLLTALRAVPDPRRGGARRHPTAYILAVLLGSFACAGFGSFAAAAQWAASANRELLLDLGAAPCPLTGAVIPSSEATIRRMACRVDLEALEAVIAAWTRRYAETEDTITRWTDVADRGGHFAAMEEPALLTGDMRDFFRPLR